MNYYLTFTYNNLRYGVPAIAVQEVFFLPEITPIPESPTDIIGTVNVRGKIIPIMDLNLRFGYAPIPYTLNDSIIIINWQELTLGILTNEVHEVKAIEEQNITSELSHDPDWLDGKQEKFISGFFQEEESLWLLLNIEVLLRYTNSQNLSLELDIDSFTLDVLESLTEDSDDAEEIPLTAKFPIFFPEATPYQRQVLQKRAENLRQGLKSRDLTGFKPLAIFTLNQEFFAVELSFVQEFIKFSSVTVIPCTPSFIVGNINLRGEIVTLVDIRNFFNLATAIISNKEYQAMVVNVEGVVIGLIIDSIENIFMLNPKDIVDSSVREHDVNQSYLHGFIPYQEKMLGLINLTEIILGGSLLVDEAV